MKINLRQKAIGIDISDRTIEVVGLKRVKEEIKVVGLARTILPPGIVKRGRIKNKEALKEKLIEVLAKVTVASAVQPPVIFGLPESQAFTYLFYLNKKSGREIKQSVMESIATTIPYPLSELEYAYRVLGSDKKRGILILISVVRRKVKREWEEFFADINQPLVWLDLEILACARGIFDKLPAKPAAILDIGASTSSLSIFTNYGLVYAHTLTMAGDEFSKRLAQQLNLNWEEAEKIKKEKGLKFSPAKEVLKPAVEILFKTIKEDINFWQKENNQQVKEVVIIGGSSRMPGLIDYLNDSSGNNFDLSVRFGHPWLKKISQDLIYIEAFGLALRGLIKKWEATDPGFRQTGLIKFNFFIFLSRLPSFSFHWLKKFLRLGPKIKTSKSIWLVGLIFLIGLLVWLFFFFHSSDYRKNQQAEPSPLATREDLKLNKKEQEAALPQLKQKQNQDVIKIKSLSSYLNVRAGPGLNFQVVGRAKPGQTYFFIEEEGEWMKIKMSSTTEGWVFARFVEKQF